MQAAASPKRTTNKSSGNGRKSRQYIMQALRLRKLELAEKQRLEKHVEERIAAEVGISEEQTAEDRALALNRDVERVQENIKDIEDKLKQRQEEKHKLFASLKEILLHENKLKAAQAAEEKEKQKIDDAVIASIQGNELEETSPFPAQLPPHSNMPRMDLDGGNEMQIERQSSEDRDLHYQSQQQYYYQPDRPQMLNPRDSYRRPSRFDSHSPPSHMDYRDRGRDQIFPGRDQYRRPESRFDHAPTPNPPPSSSSAASSNGQSMYYPPRQFRGNYDDRRAPYGRDAPPPRRGGGYMRRDDRRDNGNRNFYPPPRNSMLNPNQQVYSNQAAQRDRRY
jgi:hypothetical protein